MANPLFIASTAALKAQLRLSGTAQPDGLAMINTAMLEARLYLFRLLGQTLISTLQGYVFTEDATTAEDFARLKANMCELALVRQHLLRTMPVLFMDSSGAKREAWNDEGFTRRAQQSEVAAEIERLQLDIDQWIAELVAADGVVQGDVQGGVMETLETTLPPLLITGSIQGGYAPADDSAVLDESGALL